MIIRRQGEAEIRPDQVRAMAHGLFALAEIDGVTEGEKDLIRSFLRDGQVDIELEALAKIPFSLDELVYSLDTIFLRKTFLKVCILVAKADGAISDAEMNQLRRIAQAMGITEPLESLAADLEGKSL